MTERGLDRGSAFTDVRPAQPTSMAGGSVRLAVYSSTN